MELNKNNLIYYWDGGMSPERKKILDDALYSARYYNPTRPIYLVSNTIKQDQFDPKYKIEVVEWDDTIYDPIKSLGNIEDIKHIYKHCGPRERSDLFRLLLVYKYGGSYIDTDDIAVRSMPDHNDLSNAFCSSYDPHTCHYSKVTDADCVSGEHREAKGYEQINMFPRNDCWINFEPEHFMIKEMLMDARFTSRSSQVNITDEFSWQRLTLEVIKNNISDINIKFNYTLNLLYVYESHVAFCSHWDMCLKGGPICDIWPITRDHEMWGKYQTNKEESLNVLDKMLYVYKFSSFLWLHDKCGNPEWQIDNIDESKDYLISTHILDKIRSEYKSL